MSEVVRKVRVKNMLGLHTRPATVIVKLLQKSKSHVTFSHKKETVSAHSILNILMLAAQRNALITINVTGEDAEATMEELVDVFDKQFGEHA